MLAWTDGLLIYLRSLIHHSSHRLAISPTTGFTKVILFRHSAMILWHMERILGSRILGSTFSRLQSLSASSNIPQFRCLRPTLPWLVCWCIGLIQCPIIISFLHWHLAILCRFHFISLWRFHYLFRRSASTLLPCSRSLFRHSAMI